MQRVYRAVAAVLAVAALLGAAVVGAQQPDNTQLASWPCNNGPGEGCVWYMK